MNAIWVFVAATIFVVVAASEDYDRVAVGIAAAADVLTIVLLLQHSIT